MCVCVGWGSVHLHREDKNRRRRFKDQLSDTIKALGDLQNLGARTGAEEKTQEPRDLRSPLRPPPQALGATAWICARPSPTSRPPCKERAPDTHMGSRVLLSQDFSASKFSIIILETMHSGPQARHSPPPAQVAAATAAAAAAAPSSARRPRGPRWEAPVAGSREQDR